jgi:hypothetical protein
VKIPKLISKMTLILFLTIFGSFSFAEDKKPVPPPPATIQQGCPEDENENSCSATSSPFFETQENKTTNSDSLKPPTEKIQEDTGAKGGS